MDGELCAHKFASGLSHPANTKITAIGEPQGWKVTDPRCAGTPDLQFRFRFSEVQLAVPGLHGQWPEIRRDLGGRGAQAVGARESARLPRWLHSKQSAHLLGQIVDLTMQLFLDETNAPGFSARGNIRDLVLSNYAHLPSHGTCYVAGRNSV